MPDNKAKRGKPDRTRINVNEKYELAYWSGRLGVSPAELRRAVRLVGPIVRNVEACFIAARKKPPVRPLVVTTGDGLELAVPCQLNITKGGKRIGTIVVGERDAVVMLERLESPVKIAY